MADYLVHHGVKGQKWGVRRYRTSSGKLTSEGKKHAKESRNGFDKEKAKSVAKKAAVGAALVGATALTAYGLSNPKVRQKILDIANNPKLKDTLKAAGSKGKEFAKASGQKTLKSLSDSASRAGKAMTDAALISIGTIQINKLAKKLDPGENATQAEKDRNKVLLDTATAGINAAIRTNVSGNSGNSSGGKSVGKEVSARIGEPSKKGIDKQSSEWQGLFKDNNGNQRDADTRATIKSLAAAGYDIDQIKKYLQHSMRGENVYIGRTYVVRLV